MSILKKLFGGGAGKAGADAIVSEIEHKGFRIQAAPKKEGGQFRVAAIITKEIDGEDKEHRLIRADMCSTAEDAADIAIRKSKQFIDERGDRVFD